MIVALNALKCEVRSIGARIIYGGYLESITSTNKTQIARSAFTRVVGESLSSMVPTTLQLHNPTRTLILRSPKPPLNLSYMHSADSSEVPVRHRSSGEQGAQARRTPESDGAPDDSSSASLPGPLAFSKTCSFSFLD